MVVKIKSEKMFKAKAKIRMKKRMRRKIKKKFENQEEIRKEHIKRFKIWSKEQATLFNLLICRCGCRLGKFKSRLKIAFLQLSALRMQREWVTKVRSPSLMKFKIEITPKGGIERQKIDKHRFSQFHLYLFPFEFEPKEAFFVAS